MSIPGELISPNCRMLKVYFDLMLLTTIASPRFKPLVDPYIILPIISSIKN